MSTSAAVTPLSVRVRRISQSLEALSLDWWWRGLRTASRQTTRERFTIAKARRLIAYGRQTSLWRQLAVVVLFPVPGLIASLLTPLIPLQDPALGPRANVGFYPHVFVTAFFTLLGATIQARDITGTHHDEISSVEVVMIALIATAHLVAIVTLPCFVWRFPVPFSWVLAYAPWMMCFVWGHVVVLRGRLSGSHGLRNRLLLYPPLLSLQVSQIVLYPAYSALFEAAGFYEQLLLIAFFPLLKYGLQRSISIVAHHFHDFAVEEGVYSVEISASMYQSMIMQMAPSPLAIALVIGLDLVIGFHDVRRFMDRVCTLPRAKLVASAFHLLEDDCDPIEDDDLVVYASRRAISVPAKIVKGVKRVSAAILPGPFVGQAHSLHPSVPSAPATAALKRRSLGTLARNDRMTITQALEILQSAEYILVVEYLEVVVPIVNSVYLAVASQLPSAVYNPKIRSLYHNPHALQAAMSTIVLYSTLQGVTFLVMCVAMRVRFRLSALTLLAFLLQGRAWSLQGKMLAWVPFTFAFSVLHYGVDFTFRFDYSIPPQY